MKNVIIPQNLRITSSMNDKRNYMEIHFTLGSTLKI